MDINLSNLFVSLMASIGATVVLFMVNVGIFGSLTLDFPWYSVVALLASIVIFCIFFMRVISGG